MLKKILFTLPLAAMLASSGMYAQPQTQRGANQAPQPTLSATPNLLHARMREALHRQIAVEQYSANLYLSFATYFADLGLDGCEKFFREAAEEEQEHAMLFYNFMVDRGEKFQMQQVNASATMPTSVLDAFQKHMENEFLVTRSIHNLYAIAQEENDLATQAFLDSLVLMQVQEEKEATDLVQLLQMGPNDPAFILVFDNRLLEKLED